jgi:hypothetical protein
MGEKLIEKEINFEARGTKRRLERESTTQWLPTKVFSRECSGEGDRETNR